MLHNGNTAFPSLFCVFLQYFSKPSYIITTSRDVLKFRLSNDEVTGKQAEIMSWISPCTNPLQSYTHLTEK